MFSLCIPHDSSHDSTTTTSVQEQLSRNETMSAAQANKENEGRVDFETTVANADSNKKLKKLTSSGSKAGIKIRGQASRIVSSFKTQSIVCTLDPFHFHHFIISFFRFAL